MTCVIFVVKRHNVLWMCLSSCFRIYKFSYREPQAVDLPVVETWDWADRVIQGLGIASPLVNRAPDPVSFPVLPLCVQRRGGRGGKKDDEGRGIRRLSLAIHQQRGMVRLTGEPQGLRSAR